MHKIAVFTATRAEYGLLRPVLFRLQKMSGCKVQLLVSGTHLSEKHGYTIDEITLDGFTPAATLPIDLGQGDSESLCAAIGSLVAQLGNQLKKLAPDILVLLGDRYECLGVALAASMYHIAIAHISGGDVTYGAMDDSFRHAITKLSHLHFTSCESYRQRVIQLGEQPDRVFNVGALGVENALSIQTLPEAEIRAFLNLPENRPYILVTFHPVTLEAGQEAVQITALTTALDAFPDHDVIFTGVNADPGANVVAQHIAGYVSANPERVRSFASLGVTRYLSAARYAACVAGNSSSGVVEIPSLLVPVVNIGNRQEGRIHAASVIDCPCDSHDIKQALTLAMSPEGHQLARTSPNPYAPDNGELPSEAIARVLLESPLAGIIKKKFYDMNQE